MTAAQECLIYFGALSLVLAILLSVAMRKLDAERRELHTTKRLYLFSLRLLDSYEPGDPQFLREIGRLESELGVSGRSPDQQRSRQ